MCLVVKQNAVFVTEFVHITPFSEGVHTYRFCDICLFHILLKSYRNLFISEKSFIIRHDLELKCNGIAHFSHRYSTHVYVDYKV